MEERFARVNAFPLPDGSTIDVDIRPGEVVRVIGPNGSGKTSLLRSLAGLDAPIRPGQAIVSTCGFAMQTAMDSLIGLTVDGEFRLRGMDNPAALTGFAGRDVANLSAGEARRVAVTTATQQAPLVLLDEPSEGLDIRQMTALAATMGRVRDQGGSVVVVDHGDHWSDIADRTIAMGSQSPTSFDAFPAPDGPSLLVHDGVPFRLGERAFHPPPLNLGPGFHVLIGPNGCGKTQFLRRLRTDGVAMLPANARVLLSKHSVADELVDVDDATLQSWLGDRVLHRHPWTLSGGEQQRIALLKTLHRPANVVLLDEPEAHLDAEGRRLLHELLAKRIADGACILAATHDKALIAAALTGNSMEAP